MENSHKCNDGESKAGDAMVEDTKPPSGKAVSMSSINGDETKPQKTRLPLASLSFDTFLQPTWQSIFVLVFPKLPMGKRLAVRVGKPSWLGNGEKVTSTST